MPQITLNLSDEEYQKYVDGLAAIRAVESKCPKPKILLVFNIPLSLGFIQPVSVPLPPAQQPVIRRNGIEFSSDAEWRAHRAMTRQVLAGVDSILRAAAGGQQ